MTRVRHLLAAALLAPLLALAPAAPSAAACDPLRSGARGACVLAIQRQLAMLRYDIGTPDGVYGVSTFHAVVAFQKVQGFARTGAVDGATYWRLYHSTVVPRLRYVRSGSALEVDLTRQVMLRASGGVLVRIYDVSTGRPALPTPISNGTPFVIWKRALWGGTGYNDLEHYVNYFKRGTLLAIHAYSFVPPYPASHGCIRVPPPSAARLWQTTYVGERVYTYR